MDFAQIGIILFGATSIWMVGQKSKWQRWGYIVGLLGQPFWLYTAINAQQWGIVALSIWYTYAWGQGIYNHWLRADR